MLQVMAGFPSPSERISYLNGFLHKQLCERLDENDEWKQVALYFSLRCEEYVRSRSPSEDLLKYLDYRMCNVGLLCKALAEEHLDHPLMLLKDTEPLQITMQPMQGERLALGKLQEPFQLECEAVGFPSPKYQWYFEKQNMPHATNRILQLDHFKIANVGRYHCKIYHTKEDGTSSAIDTNEVVIKPYEQKPVIIKHPSSVTVVEGGDIDLDFTVTGWPAPVYKWFRDDRSLGEQTNSVLTLDCVNSRHEGRYKCVAYNHIGSVESVAVYVGVTSRNNLDVPHATAKIALIIGNSDYKDWEKLSAPSEDVVVMTEIMMKLGFCVIVLTNLTLLEMKQALANFCSLLTKGAYGVLYFAGHSFEVNERMYMVPVDAPGPRLVTSRNSVYKTDVHAAMTKKELKLCFLILDSCRTVIDKRVNPGLYAEQVMSPQFKPQDNFVIAFATTSNLNAYENRYTKTSLYVKHLRKYLPKYTVCEALDNVNRDMHREMSSRDEKQIPSYYKNLPMDIRLGADVIETDDSKIAKANFQSWCQSFPNFTVKYTSLPGLTVKFHFKSHFYVSNSLVLETECQNDQHAYLVTVDCMAPGAHVQVKDEGKLIHVTNLQRLQDFWLVIKLQHIFDGTTWQINVLEFGKLRIAQIFGVDVQQNNSADSGYQQHCPCQLEQQGCSGHSSKENFSTDLCSVSKEYTFKEPACIEFPESGHFKVKPVHSAY